MTARQVVLQTLPESSHPRPLLSRQYTAPVSPLAATLMDLPASVANKRLTENLNPLDATLAKNTGVGPHPLVLSVPTSRCVLRIPHVSAGRPGIPTILQPRVFNGLRTLPSYVSRNPCICHSYENAGCVPTIPIPELARKTNWMPILVPNRTTVFPTIISRRLRSRAGG